MAMGQNPLFISSLGRSFTDPGGSSYSRADSPFDVSITFPDSASNTEGNASGLKAVFSTNLQIANVGVGENPSMVLRLRSGGEARREIRRLISGMSKRQLNETTIAFSGTLQGFAQERVDKVVANLQASSGRAYREADKAHGGSDIERSARNDGDLLASASPSTKVRITLSGTALGKLAKGKSYSYPALRAIKQEDYFRYR